MVQCTPAQGCLLRDNVGARNVSSSDHWYTAFVDEELFVRTFSFACDYILHCTCWVVRKSHYCWLLRFHFVPRATWLNKRTKWVKIFQVNWRKLVSAAAEIVLRYDQITSASDLQWMLQYLYLLKLAFYNTEVSGVITFVGSIGVMFSRDEHLDCFFTRIHNLYSTKYVRIEGIQWPKSSM